MKLKILYIGGPQKWFAGLTEPHSVVETRSFGSGLPHLEYEFYEHIAAHNTIEIAVDAERDGFDAVVVGCFYDPGVWEARELVRIPVIGVGEATLHLAAMLSAGRFSVLVGRRKWIARMSANARTYGLDSRIASWRELNLAVPDMKDTAKAEAAVLREARAAVEQDRAEAVCLGCTGLIGLAERAAEELRVPVLDPVLVGVKTAEFQATLWKRFGISHSKAAGYEAPPADELAPLYKASYGRLQKLFRGWR
jgi:allantoin racemase